MAATKPTILLVPGAWYPVSTYDKLAAQLSARGFKSVPVVLPSSTTDARATFLDDLTAVRTAILNETTAGRDVVVVAHSYGCFPAQSAAKGLTAGSPDPDTAGGSGKVLGFILLASGFTLTGVSFLGGFGGKPPPSWNANTDTGYAELIADPVDMFFHDLPADEGKKWAAQLGSQSLAALADGGEHVYASWTEVPNYYVATKEDRAMPAALQQFAVDWATKQGADVTLRALASGHSPMLSRPEETAAIVQEAAEAFVAKRAERSGAA